MDELSRYGYRTTVEYYEENRSILARLASKVYPQRMDISTTKEIARRTRILNFWKEFGLPATRKAHEVSRATLYRWERDLTPRSRAHTKDYQKRVIHPRVTAEIIRLRSIPETSKLGKGKLLPLLESFCLANHIPEVLSESRVGRILTELNHQGRIPDPKKLRVDARTGKLHLKKYLKRVKLRRNGYLPAHPGDFLQVDGVTIFIDGIRRYTFTAVDLISRWTYSRTYGSATSGNGADFLKRLLIEAPFPVHHIQTDNGSEFLALFASADAHITHFFNYPRSPKYQGWIESFNNTIQREFLQWYKADLAGPTDYFNTKLEAWTSWYNQTRPHSSLINPATRRQLSPLQYLATLDQSHRG